MLDNSLKSEILCPVQPKKANKMLPSLGNEIKSTILYVFKITHIMYL